MRGRDRYRQISSIENKTKNKIHQINNKKLYFSIFNKIVYLI